MDTFNVILIYAFVVVLVIIGIAYDAARRGP
jgi:hypothetical protein